MKTKIAVVLLGAVMATSCTTKGATVYLPATTVEATTTSTEVATYDKYDDYIQTVQNEYPNLVASREYFIDLSIKLCNLIAMGATPAQMARFAKDIGLDTGVFGGVIGITVRILCPENRVIIENWQND